MGSTEVVNRLVTSIMPFWQNDASGAHLYSEQKFWLHLSVLSFFIFISCVFTYPLIFHLGDTVRDPGDPLLNSWILAWDVHKLTSNPKDFFDANIFYPYSHTLAYSEHMFASALLAFPFIAISGNPLLGHNAVLLLSFILTGFTTYLLVRELTGSVASGIIAGVIFAFAPYRVAQLSHLQLLTIQWLPLTFLFLHRFFHSGKICPLILFLLFFNLQALSSYYLALQMILGVGMYVIYRLMVDPQVRGIKYLGGLGLAALFSLLVNLPFALPYMQLASTGQVRSLSESEGFSARLTNYLATPSENLLYGKLTAAFQGTCGMECQLFPGLVSVILAILGFLLAGEALSKERQEEKKSWGDQGFYLLLLLVAFILTLGPYYHLGEDLRIPLPYLLFHHYFPGFKAMRVPARFGMTVMFALAALAGYGMKAFQTWMERKRVHASYRSILCLLPMVFVVGEFSVVPGTTTIYSFPGKEVPPVYRWLASLKKPVTIVELPMLYDGGFPLRAEFQYMYYSAFHWQKIVNGWSGFLPPLFWELYDGLQSFPDSRSLAALQGIGVDYAIVHADKVGPGKMAGILALASEGGPLALVGQFGTAYMFQVRPNAYKGDDVPAMLHTSLLVPSQVQAGRGVTLAVSLQNRGSKSLVFYPAEKGHLRISWEEGGSETSYDFFLPLVILPGESVPVSVTIPSPPGEGWRTVLVDVDAAGLGIHRVLQGKTQLIDRDVSAGSLSGHSAVEYREVQSPSWVEAGERFSVPVRVRNSGNTIWYARTLDGNPPKQGEIYLYVPAWLDERGRPIEGSAFRGDLPHDVAPGDEAEITLKVPAPLLSGNFQMQVGMAGGSLPFTTERDKPVVLPIEVISAAPALAAVGEEVAMAVRGEDGRVWVNQTEGGEWTEWRPIPGGNVLSVPSLAAVGDELVVAVRREDGGIWINRTQREEWVGWEWIGEAPSAPALAEVKGEVVVAVQGGNREVWVNRTEEGKWAGWSPIPGGDMLSAPALAVKGEEMLAAVWGGNGGVWVNRLQGQEWVGWSPVGGEVLSVPALAIAGGEIAIAVWGGDKGIWVNQTVGGQWQGWDRIGDASSAPVLAVMDGEMVVVTQGGDRGIWAKRLNRGIWQAAPQLEPEPTSALGVVSVGNTLVVAEQRRNGVIWVNRFGKEGWKKWERVPAVREEAFGAG